MTQMTCYSLIRFCLFVPGCADDSTQLLFSTPTNRTLIRVECKKKAFCSTKWSKSNLNVCFFRRPKLSTSGSTKSDPCPHRIQCFFAMWRNNWESHHSLPLLSSCGSDSEKKNIDLCPCPTSDEVPRLRLVTWKQERQFQRYRGCKWTKRAKALSLDTRVVQLVFLRSNQRMGWTAQS